MREALKYSPLCRRTLDRTPSACLAAIYMYHHHHLYEHVHVLILFFLSNPRNDTYLWNLPTILIILLRLSRKPEVAPGVLSGIPFLATACVLGNSFLAATGPQAMQSGREHDVRAQGCLLLFISAHHFVFSRLLLSIRIHLMALRDFEVNQVIKRVKMNWSLRRMRGYWKDKGKASYIAGWGRESNEKLFVFFLSLVSLLQ